MRRTSPERYLDLVGRIGAIPSIALTTDLIVGFPAEEMTARRSEVVDGSDSTTPAVRLLAAGARPRHDGG